MELTEKLLVSMGGWPAFKEARAIHAAGRVSEATYEPPVLRGKLSEGGKQFLAGLRLKNPIDVENLCPCRDSRIKGMICAHSLAVGLQVLSPAKAIRQTPAEAAPKREEKNSTKELPIVVFSMEGSLRHLEGTIRFDYTTPGVANVEAERTALEKLIECGFGEEGGKAVLKGESAIVTFFAAALPRLRKEWKVEEGERFQHVTKDFVRIEPQFAIREQGGGVLDLRVHYTAGKEAVFSASDLRQLLAGGQSHVTLKDGRIAVADPHMADDLEEMLRDCNPEQNAGRYRFAPVYKNYLTSSIAGWKNTPLKEVASVEELGTLEKRLRPYQVEGARWMLHRAKSGLGGLLADEMGLGKTVQSLAMLEVLGGPSLVVCPSSLVWNWKREAQHFLPGLSVLTMEGPGREAHFSTLSSNNLIVTSYGLLRRDIEEYRKMTFRTVILDEAQHIKNPGSQNAKAACALKAQSRFILTGTPVENSIRDLWSLYEFLLPGYLGSRTDFRERYETPLLNGESGPLWSRLSRRIQPYLLRRKKQEILKELPDKIEQIIEVELTEKQKAAYFELVKMARTRVEELREQGGAGAARMQVFTALLRLRQAACDLRLLGVESDRAEASAKLSAVSELLSEAIDGGHRVLLFSQFTSMLDLVGEMLDEQKIVFCRLDGSTKNRGQIVDEFQTGNVPVFLISLKAGGVGLNLTAADTVIHFDPWWNPAVEAQATDRAHRIGQKNVVTSIKLIARDTVEERVLRLQEKKRELLMATVDSEADFSAVSVDDLEELLS